MCVEREAWEEATDTGLKGSKKKKRIRGTHLTHLLRTGLESHPLGRGMGPSPVVGDQINDHWGQTLGEKKLGEREV